MQTVEFYDEEFGISREINNYPVDMTFSYN